MGIGEQCVGTAEQSPATATIGALATDWRAKHWRGIAGRSIGIVVPSAGIVLTSIAAASKRQAQRRHRTDQLSWRGNAVLSAGMEQKGNASAKAQHRIAVA
jgi:hypothetical protein